MSQPSGRPWGDPDWPERLASCRIAANWKVGKMMPLMAGKQGLIMGVANERSIAWGIAKALHAHGANLAFTYQGEALGKRVRPLALSLNSDVVLEADVASAASLDAGFAT